MCDRDSDPLLTKLFRDYDLSLLRVAYTPAELPPSTVIVCYPPTLRRNPVRYQMAKIFTPAPQFAAFDAPYSRIEIGEKSAAVAASVLADLSGLLGADADVGAVEAALRVKNVGSFQVSLGAATRHDIDEAAVNRFIHRAQLTEEAEDLRSRGCKFHIVLRTVTANQVRLESNSALDSELSAKLTGTSGTLKVSAEGQRTVTMSRVGTEMVIGFRAVLVVGEEELSLAGLTGPLTVKGGGQTPAQVSLASDVLEFTSDGTNFVALERAD